MDYNSAIWSFIVITLFSCSCKPHVEGGGGYINLDAIAISVDASNIKDSVDLSTIIKGVDIIPLKEQEDNFIGEVWKVMLSGDFYVVFDRYVTKRIHVYTANGELYKSIIPNGDGPNEILQISDCWVNDNGNLEVYDFQLNRIMVFDEKFNPQKTYKGKSHLFLNSVQNIGTKYVGFSGYNDYNKAFRGNYYKMAVMDSNFRIEKTAFHFDRKLKGALISTPVNPFGKVGGETIFHQDYDPNIYIVNYLGDFDIKYKLNYSPIPIPENFELQIIAKNLSIFKSQEVDFERINNIYKGYSGFSGPWLESNDYAVFNSFDENYDRFTSIYDKRDNEIIAQGKNLVDRKNKLTVPYFHTADPSENCFIAVLEGYILHNYIKTESPNYEMVKNWGNENLYLVKITLK